VGLRLDQVVIRLSLSKACQLQLLLVKMSLGKSIECQFLVHVGGRAVKASLISISKRRSLEIISENVGISP
jgi:hypothetical protein